MGAVSLYDAVRDLPLHVDGYYLEPLEQEVARGFTLHRTVVVLHMITGEILLGAIPFTKLGHMPFLIFSRFFLSAERSWRPAARRW